MATTQLKFITQPNATVQGWKLTGGAQAQPTVYSTSGGIQVGLYDANNVLQTADTAPITITISTNPTAGSVLSGTTTVTPVNGVASFNDLAISLGGNGYVLQAADGGITTTSQAFNVSSVYRTNPTRITGAPTAIGIANAIGPYRFRGGRSITGVRVGFVSNNATDVAQVVVTEPNVALSANTAMVPKVTNYSGSVTAPAYVVFDGMELGGDVDIYVYTTTQTGTPTVTIERVESRTAP